MMEDVQYVFEITCAVTAHSEDDALRLLSPSLVTMKALDVKRQEPRVELVAEVPAWSRPQAS